MCPSAEAYTHKDCGQQVMLRPSLLIPLMQMKGVLEKLTRLVLNTSEHIKAPGFSSSGDPCIPQLSCAQKVSCSFSGTSLIKLSCSQPRIFLETGSHVAQPGLELATAEDDLKLIFCLPIPGRFRHATIPSSPLTTCQ